jgi:hypothetical protein
MLDPVVLFFVLGVAAKLAKSDLRLPEALYEALAIYLLLAIGLKGGVELARQPSLSVLPHALAAIALSAAIPLLLYPILRALGRLSGADSASIGAPPSSMRPDVAGVKPLRQSMKVVLPAPFGPISPAISRSPTRSCL